MRPAKTRSNAGDSSQRTRGTRRPFCTKAGRDHGPRWSCSESSSSSLSSSAVPSSLLSRMSGSVSVRGRAPAVDREQLPTPRTSVSRRLFPQRVSPCCSGPPTRRRPGGRPPVPPGVFKASLRCPMAMGSDGLPRHKPQEAGCTIGHLSHPSENPAAQPRLLRPRGRRHLGPTGRPRAGKATHTFCGRASFHLAFAMRPAAKPALVLVLCDGSFNGSGAVFCAVPSGTEQPRGQCGVVGPLRSASHGTRQFTFDRALALTP